MPSLLAVLVVSASVSGCATKSGEPTTGRTVASLTAVAISSDTGKAAIGALANRIGIGDKYVSLALDTASSLLGSGQATAEQKAVAAQKGVDRAAAQAKDDGKPLSDAQKSSLLDGIQALL